MSGFADAAHSRGQWLELISARLDGELEPGETADLEVHLASCDECTWVSARIADQHTQIPGPEPDGHPLLVRRVIDERHAHARTRKARRTMAVAAVSVLVADAASKVWASAFLVAPVPLVGSLSLQLGHNPGVAFGIGSALPVWAVLVVTGVLCGGIAWAGWAGWLQPPLAAGLIVGGAVGNLVDRMFGGSVVDMIHLTWWPTFNLADVAICTGVALMAVRAFWPQGEASEA